VVSQLEALSPSIREKVQLLLAGLEWKVPPAAMTGLGRTELKDAPDLRRKLGLGSHFEVDIRDDQMHWRGIADVIDVTGAGGCTITDFKTGEYDKSHEYQLQVYALLWRRDHQRNPLGQAAAKLILAYPNRKLVVAPLEGVAERGFQEELAQRSAAVRNSLSTADTKANLSVANCQHCPVRLLCSDYWKSTRPFEKETPARGCFDDIQLVLREQRALNVWAATSEASSILPSGSAALVRFPGYTPYAEALTSGRRVRLTDAALSPDENGVAGLVNVVGTTELLFPS